MDNTYREVLFCSFPTSQNPRQLDSAKFPGDQIFTIGRHFPTEEERLTHLFFPNKYMSRFHAELRYSPGDSKETCYWQIRHIASTPKTFTLLNKQRLPQTANPDQDWVQIREQDKAIFGTADSWIRFSYIPDPTLSPPLIEIEETRGTTQLPTNKNQILVFWQAQAIKVFFDEMQETPTNKLVVIIIGFLCAFALFLVLGFALQ